MTFVRDTVISQKAFGQGFLEEMSGFDKFLQQRLINADVCAAAAWLPYIDTHHLPLSLALGVIIRHPCRSHQRGWAATAWHSLMPLFPTAELERATRFELATTSLGS